jgi:hypothetical protein
VVLRLRIIHAALNSRRLSRFPEKFGLVRTLHQLASADFNPKLISRIRFSLLQILAR